MRFLDTYRIRSRFDERIPARDGVQLSADVYLPPEPGQYPVLITRTPYDNNRSSRAAGSMVSPPGPADRFKRLAACGFVVVAADARGRGDSDGTFTPFVHEATDGADVVSWAAALPESTGRVGLFGAGYAGFAALANATHPAVGAVAAWSPFGAGEGLPSRGGAIRLDWLFWMHVVGGRTPQPPDVPPWHDVFRHRPLATMHRALGRPDVPWREWLNHPDPDDEFWSALDLDETLSAATAPALFVTGWWDGCLGATVRHWTAARRSPARARHRLVVGPWDAAAVRRPSADVGGVPWGSSAVLDPDELLIDWFTANLVGGAAPSIAPGARVFVTGRNVWADLTEWPTGPADTRDLWLSSGGRANTRRGDGSLSPVAVREQPPDRFVHDPDRPLPWQPGNTSFSRTALASFTLDTSFATTRDDTLVYTADPVPGTLRLRGRPQVTLWAETDADDADWVVGIEDVFPGGVRTMHLAHGVVRAGSRPGFEPGRPIRYTITLTEVCHDLLPDHAIRLVVSSSLFPLYAVNLGGERYVDATTPRLARQAVHHDATHRSRLTLPLARTPPGTSSPSNTSSTDPCPPR